MICHCRSAGRAGLRLPCMDGLCKAAVQRDGSIIIVQRITVLAEALMHPRPVSATSLRCHKR